MSERRPFCIWVTPSRPGSASYAQQSRFGTIEAARKAIEREYPTGRTGLGAKVTAGHENGGPE